MKTICYALLFLFCCTFHTMAQDQTIPTITEIAPPRAQVDEKVTIKGSNFNRDRKKNIVHFGTVIAEVIDASPEQLVVKVPKGAKVCNVTVEVMGQRSKETRFYVLPYIEFSLAEKSMTPGQKTKGILKIHGSKKPWKIKVVNKYYEVIDLPAGNEQVVISSGGDDNKAEIEIFAKKMGSFSLICKKIEEVDDPGAVASNLTATPSKTPGTGEVTPAPTMTPAVKETTPAPTTSPVVKETTPAPTTSPVVKETTPAPTTSPVVKESEPTPAKTTIAIKSTPWPTKTPMAKETAPSPAMTPMAKETAPAPAMTPEVKETKSSGDTSPSPDISKSHGPEPVKSIIPKSTDRNSVLAYCNKLKEKISTLKNDAQKIQKEIEDKKELYGTRRGIEDAGKQKRLSDIDDRGKKIAKRLADIPHEISALKKEESDKNKAKIENLQKEEAKLEIEQKNVRVWKKKIASDYSKEVNNLKKAIKGLMAKRDSLQQQIKKLQDEYDNKLKSLVSCSRESRITL